MRRLHLTTHAHVRRGQALMVAVLLMMAILLVGILFVALVTYNQDQSTRHEDSLLAQAMAESGVRYAAYMLENSPEGADWRPPEPPAIDSVGAVDPDAFIRPSPAGATLGGVARSTRETILVCEAAGFDVVLVETVGVGQSETVVADMVDFFLVLMLAGAGDDLQGIKKGVLELADLIAINKADGDNRERAERAAADYRAALHLLQPTSPTWTPPVLLCSGLHNEGLDELWRQVLVHRARLSATGELDEKRRDQQVRWMWSMLDDRLRDDLRSYPEVTEALREHEELVRSGKTTPTSAVEDVWALYVSLR